MAVVLLEVAAAAVLLPSNDWDATSTTVMGYSRYEAPLLLSSSLTMAARLGRDKTKSIKFFLLNGWCILRFAEVGREVGGWGRGTV